MNNKLLIIPTIALSSILLLTGCVSGNSEQQQNPSASSSSSTNIDSSNQGDVEYIAPPEKLDDKYNGYYYAPTTVNEEAWSYYKSVGAKTYKEDPSNRSTGEKEWNKARSDNKDYAAFDRMYGEVSSDVEQTALNVSAYLETNPETTVEDLNKNSDLIVNRYKELGSTVIEKDSETGYYFSLFIMKKSELGVGYGILVPQKNITPNF